MPQLVEAWRFDTGESGGFQVNPIVVDGVMYSPTPLHKVVALDAATGRLRWTFDSKLDSRGPNRGVTYWQNGDERRLFVAADQYLYALDAATGVPIDSFGTAGRIDLRRELGRDPAAQSIRLTTPGVVYKDLLIIGGRAGEGAGSSPGDIRAYDVRSGALRWTFHTIPRPGETGYERGARRSWTVNGGANNWAGMALDEARGLVFVPTGSAAPDFHGADRPGDNLFANSLLALDAATGKRRWHFQAVHHDIWDRDFPAPPTLVTVRREGRVIDAVAQTTKQGFVFVLDRDTGLPVFPVDERPVPASTVPGERAARTQPVPQLPPPFARQRLTADLLTRRTPEAHAWALAAVREAPHRRALHAAASRAGYGGLSGLRRRRGVGRQRLGSSLGPPVRERQRSRVDRRPGPRRRRHRWTRALSEVVRVLPPRRPARHAAADSGAHESCDLRRPAHDRDPAGRGTDAGLPESGARRRTRAGGLPARQPGTRRGAGGHASRRPPGPADGSASPATRSSSTPTAIPPRRRRGARSRPSISTPGSSPGGSRSGEYPELVAQGLTDTGSENYGGPIVTAGGLVFIGATNFDRKFRAFDASNGRLLWQVTLPFAANTTPATYEAGGRQYVLVAAGGGRSREPSGGVFIAYRLP